MVNDFIDPFKKEELLNSIETLRSFVENLNVKKSCSSCIFFNENTMKCGKFNQVIPDHILLNGCSEWEFDIIPY